MNNFYTLFVLVLIAESSGQPDLSDTPFEPIVLEAGDKLLIECVAHQLGDNTLMWKRKLFNETELLTVGLSRVINDERVSVIHNKASDQWLLSIHMINITDSGMYICETNSIPSISAFRSVIITSHTLEVAPPDLTSLEINTNHSYKECCAKRNVPQQCQEFCSFSKLMSERFDPRPCIEYLPVFGECMSDGRDHSPCCKEQKIPGMCAEICRGSFSISTVVEHYTCSPFTQSVMACISRGIVLLPSPPESIFTEALSESRINVSWSEPTRQPQGVDMYVIDVVEINEFDSLGNIKNEDPNQSESGNQKSSDGKFVPQNSAKSKTWQVKVGSDKSFHVVENLRPFTMYEITVRAENKYGSSQKTYRKRALTMQPSSPHLLITKGPGPDVPDIKKCCLRKGMQLTRCVTTLCDPERSDEAVTEDFVICAPWINITFGCMANGMDHRPCCKQRGLPPLCQQLCSGNVSRINYRYFVCIQYMPHLTNCLLKGYGVLSSAARELDVTNVHPTWVLLQWKPPAALTHTVSSYHVHYRPILDSKEEEESSYSTIERVTSPYMLEGLEPNTRYEIYVSPVNRYGLGEGTPRIVFKTRQITDTGTTVYKNDSMQLGDCCRKAGMLEKCLPLCDYKASISTLITLEPECSQFNSITMRCAAAGRDHTFCCSRRRISPMCVSLCAGYVGQLNDHMHHCNSHLGQIIECLEEGVRTLPGLPRDFHTTAIRTNEVELEWSHPNDENVVTYYTVYIREEDYSMNKMYPYRLGANVTVTSAKLTKLTPGRTYGIYVSSGNKYGTSLPSYIINIKTLTFEEPGLKRLVVKAKPERPSDFEVTRLGINDIALNWKATVHVHPDDSITYGVFYAEDDKINGKLIMDRDARVKKTNFTRITLNNLKPETRYQVWAYTFTSSNGSVHKSLKSDVLLVHTDHPISAHVSNVQILPPKRGVEEGTNVMALCVTSGRPDPTIRIFVDSRLLAEGVRHHISSELKNVTRRMKEVICYAENGYGSGSRKTLPLNVVFAPDVTTKHNTITVDGSVSFLQLECVVTGNPEPELMWFRQFNDQRQTLVTSPRHLVSVTTKYRVSEYPTYIMTMKVTDLVDDDFGSYRCTAQNKHGAATNNIRVIRKDVHWESNINVTECCRRQNVSTVCLDACVFDIDIQRALNRPSCIPELEKMMKCAADGSDHRRCCLSKNVPRRCVNWCRGLKVRDASLCVLGYAKHIVDCFEEGNTVLPGPPEKLKYVILSNHTSVELIWDPPVKNPEYVEYYKIFWRRKSSKRVGHQMTVVGRSNQLHSLQPGREYEVLVKAYNHYGKSLPSNRIRVSMPALHDGMTGVSITSQSSSQSSKLSVALGIITVLFILVLLCIAVIIIKKRFLTPKIVRTGGVSFENPSYLKEPGNTNAESPKNGVKTTAGDITMSSLSNGVRSQPNVYEELKSPS